MEVFNLQKGNSGELHDTPKLDANFQRLLRTGSIGANDMVAEKMRTRSMYQIACACGEQEVDGSFVCLKCHYEIEIEQTNRLVVLQSRLSTNGRMIPMNGSWIERFSLGSGKSALRVHCSVPI